MSYRDLPRHTTNEPCTVCGSIQGSFGRYCIARCQLGRHCGKGAPDKDCRLVSHQKHLLPIPELEKVEKV